MFTQWTPRLLKQQCMFPSAIKVSSECHQVLPILQNGRLSAQKMLHVGEIYCISLLLILLNLINI